MQTSTPPCKHPMHPKQDTKDMVLVSGSPKVGQQIDAEIAAALG